MKPAEYIGPLIHEHSLIAGGPTVVISHSVLVDGFQLFSILLIHNQMAAPSQAWLSFQIAFLLSLPVVPTTVMSLCTDWAQNPLTSTSTGNNQVRQPCFLHELGVLLFPRSTSIFHQVVPSRIDACCFPPLAMVLTCFDEGHLSELEDIHPLLFSSPEHKVLRLSYCDRPLSVVRRRPSCVVRRA